jgi:hypothetical protein
MEAGWGARVERQVESKVDSKVERQVRSLKADGRRKQRGRGFRNGSTDLIPAI